MFVTSLKTLAPRLRFRLNKPVIENVVFRLHYQLTVTFLLLCGLIVCARELFGDHIKCFAGAEFTKKYGKWIDTYCFFMSTFTIKENYDETKVKNGTIAHPGLGSPVESHSTIIHHKFYQWVPFLLFMQAICFYMPHYIWKKEEGGSIKALVDGLQFAALTGEDDIKVKNLSVPSRKTLDEKLNIIKREFLLRLRVNWTWSVWLVAMEVTNVLNVVFQVWIVDRFLDGTFIGLGGNVISFDGWGITRVTPLTSIFPMVTKCDFNKYGAGGSLQNIDVLCVMALNVVHEKIFTMLWFWFFVLFIVSIAAVIWRVASFFLSRYSKRFSTLMFRKASSTKLDPEHVHRVVQNCHFSDWLFIYYLAKNMNGIAFSKLLKIVAQEMENQEMEDKLGSRKIGFEPMGCDDEKTKCI